MPVTGAWPWTVGAHCGRPFSILSRQHDGNAERAVIGRPAQPLEPDQGRRALPVVLPEFGAKALPHLRPQPSPPLPLTGHLSRSCATPHAPARRHLQPEPQPAAPAGPLQGGRQRQAPRRGVPLRELHQNYGRISLTGAASTLPSSHSFANFPQSVCAACPEGRCAPPLGYQADPHRGVPGKTLGCGPSLFFLVFFVRFGEGVTP
jgi:hypothetical protein